MNEASVLIGPLVTGCVMSAVLMSLFFVQEHHKERRERIRYARLISVELNRVRDIVKPLPWGRFDVRTDHLVGSLPRNTYDGLVASSMISVFNEELQHQLHTFYENMEARQHAYLRNKVEVLLADVYSFRNWNERRRYFFRRCGST